MTGSLWKTIIACTGAVRLRWDMMRHPEMYIPRQKVARTTDQHDTSRKHTAKRLRHAHRNLQKQKQKNQSLEQALQQEQNANQRLQLQAQTLQNTLDHKKHQSSELNNERTLYHQRSHEIQRANEILREEIADLEQKNSTLHDLITDLRRTRQESGPPQQTIGQRAKQLLHLNRTTPPDYQNLIRALEHYPHYLHEKNVHTLRLATLHQSTTRKKESHLECTLKELTPQYEEQKLKELDQQTLHTIHTWIQQGKPHSVITEHYSIHLLPLGHASPFMPIIAVYQKHEVPPLYDQEEVTLPQQQDVIIRPFYPEQTLQ